MNLTDYDPWRMAQILREVEIADPDWQYVLDWAAEFIDVSLDHHRNLPMPSFVREARDTAIVEWIQMTVDTRQHGASGSKELNGKRKKKDPKEMKRDISIPAIAVDLQADLAIDWPKDRHAPKASLFESVWRERKKEYMNRWAPSDIKRSDRRIVKIRGVPKRVDGMGISYDESVFEHPRETLLKLAPLIETKPETK